MNEILNLFPRCGDCQFFERCSQELVSLDENETFAEFGGCDRFQAVDDKTRQYREEFKQIMQYTKEKDDEKHEFIKKALAKQIPKKPTQYKHYNCIVYRCPVCGKLLTTYYTATNYFIYDRAKYCEDCGQLLDWDKEEEKNEL